MQNQLYPPEYAQDSIERHLARHSRRSHAIYLTVVLALLAAIASLPFLRVSVAVQSGGIIRPVTEKHEVRARTSGVVDRLLVRENQTVRRGEPLLVLRAGELENRGRLVESKLAEGRRAVHDLEMLTRSGGAAAGSAFQSPRYRQEHARHVNALQENALKRDRAEREAERTRALFERSLIARTELEDREFQLSQLRAEASMIRERQLAEWQAALAAERTALRELEAERAAVAEESTSFTVTAPVTGTVEQVAGISAGSFVTGGEALAVISPSSSLVAEVFVSPRDIGMLRVGAPVRVQVDAFNYTDWGFVTGRVEEISGDFEVVSGEPVFTVKCALDRDHLALRNGFRGRLKKGMTLRAHFTVAERSLFQLLHDDVNDWLNPAQSRA